MNAVRGWTCAIVMGATLLAPSAAIEPASAHRHPCHPRHECPSDHATYKWRGLRCVKPDSPKRNSTFRKKVRYGGKTYYCKR